MGFADYTKLYDLLKKAGNVEAQETIMDLREDHLQAREELQSLREENRRLRDQLQTANSLRYEDVYYWIVKQDDVRDGPFCQVCKDNNDKLIRLQRGYRQGSWRCEVCLTVFQDRTYVEPHWNAASSGASWKSA